MKRIASLFLFFSFVSVMYAQHSDYDLSSYKTGDYKRKSLDADLGSSGVFQNDMQNGKDQTFNAKLSFTYNQTKNTRKLYEKMYLRLNGNVDYANKDNEVAFIQDLGAYDKKKRKENGVDYRLSFNRVGYHYIKENNLFLEFSPLAAFGQFRNTRRESTVNYVTSPNKNKTRTISANVLINLGIGKGRLENVEDARQAVYILDELQKKGILTRELTNDEINEMATVMTRIKNKRQFDSRIRLIEEIETIDSLLVANGYIDKSHNTAYYTSLYDNWMYGNTPERLSGSRISVGITPEYSFNRMKYDSWQDVGSTIDYKDISTLFKGALYIDYRYEKPVKLKFQNSLSVSLRSALGKYRFEHYFDQHSLDLYYAWGYYPNTRTYVSLGIGESFNYLKEDFKHSKDNKSLNSYTYLSSNAYYYLSPQLRLSGTLDLSYRFRRDISRDLNLNDKHPRTSFSLGLTYSFF